MGVDIKWSREKRQLQRANGSFVPKLHQDQAHTKVHPARQQRQHKRQHIGIVHHAPLVRIALPAAAPANHSCLRPSRARCSVLALDLTFCHPSHNHNCAQAAPVPVNDPGCPQLMAPSCCASSSLHPSSPCQQYHSMCACVNNEYDGANQLECREDDNVVTVPSPKRRGVSLTQDREDPEDLENPEDPEDPEDPGGDQEQILRLLGCVSWSNLLVDEVLEPNTIATVAKLHDVTGEEVICLCPKLAATSGQGITHTCQCVRARHATRSCIKSKLKRHWKCIAVTLTALVMLTLWLGLSSTPSERSSLASSSEGQAIESETTTKALIKPAQPTVALITQASSLPSFPSLEVHGNAEMERVMDIYCRGPILHAVQMANVFSDSKHFVDMPIKENSSAFDIIMDFQKRKLAMTEFRSNLNPSSSAHNNNNNHNNHNIDNNRLKRELSHEVLLRHFVNDHFDPPGSELIPITPFDYQELQIPPMIADIQDEQLRDWAFSLHQLWRTLGRVPNPRVRSSYLHAKPFEALHLYRVQNILIVPGGRFRESYYWDSYWIVQGLLVSNMKHTARGVVNNLLEYVAEFGFVPNGGRIYYLTRSQPPMLSDMVKLVAQAGHHNATKVDFDASYLNATVPILEREYRFWMQLGPGGHAVEFVRPSVDDPTKNVSYLLNRYTSSANHPRPESYREDVDVAAEIYGTSDDGIAAADTESKKDMYYNDIIAAAESGWDFSSRWLRDKLDMKTMRTSCIIPVDLNAIMYRMEKNLETFHKYLGNVERARFFRHASRQRVHGMNEVLWSDKHNTWKDYNLEAQTHSNIVSVSDYTPLWAKAFDPNDTQRLQRVVKAIQDSGLLQVGGIQTTDVYTGQQWDAPNAWPPEQDIVIEGLLAVNTKEAHEMARKLMQSWVHSSLTAYRQTGLMFEKYNATEIGGLGVGGEYFPQFGFGWTNGVILKFLTIHQNLLLD